ncbi:MAG TPA: prolipoprotein diacylglyceryl transferase, partial [Tissierellia bacterium]|nr:prolipoprotein diacylglyceryl transferase [Tissierellia bacterium]
GEIFLLYGILYSVGRFFIEGLRTDSLMMGSLRTAQVISILIILVFGALWIVGRNKNKRLENQE